ncbi:MAG: L-lactate transport [Firmicutes bacterium]|nr:L-lactate transport [Bacillota bacterium]
MMTWTQIYDPMNNLAISSLFAAIPIIVIFYLLVQPLRLQLQAWGLFMGYSRFFGLFLLPSLFTI